MSASLSRAAPLAVLLIQSAIQNSCPLPVTSPVPGLPTDMVDVLPLEHPSERIKDLFADARKAANRPIRFSQFRDGARNTSAVVASQREYVVMLRPGMDNTLQENSIAHELFHIILQNDGFASGVSVEEGSKWALELGYTITSCVDDALIDKRMAKLGFRPEILNKDSVDQLRQAPPYYALGNLNDPVFFDGSALIVLCFSSRKRNSGDEIEPMWQVVSPRVVARAHELVSQIGTLDCEDAKTCNARKRAIRDALAYRIRFCDPLTGKYE